MKILLVGAGGYASLYVNALLNNTDPDIRWVGVVDPYFSSCSNKEAIKKANIPVYDTMEAFYKEHTAELAVISTPPFLHCAQSVYALEHGSHVLCEKPVAPTVAEADMMIAAEEQYGRFIAVGYQWSFSTAIQALKKDILNNTLGRPISFKTAVSWPRNRAYYNRGSGWGGRISKDGHMILDSIASNACAHYLHNMFFLLGCEMNSSRSALSVDADCLRANNIENFDTCSLRILMPDNVNLYYIASHAAERLKNPEFVYTFEKATVFFSEDEGSVITAVFKDGSSKCYGNPFESVIKKLWDCVDAVKSGTTPICTAKTARAHTQLIRMLYEDFPISDFPKELIRENRENDGIFVDGLFEKMYQAYEQEKLLSELT